MDHGIGRYAHALLRVGVGLWLVEHGLQKEFDSPAFIELIGGVLLVAGLFTRPSALVLMVETLAMALVAHASHGRWPLETDVELGLLAGLALASVAATGAGPFSVDELMHNTLRRERRKSETHDRRNPYAVSL